MNTSTVPTVLQSYISIDLEGIHQCRQTVHTCILKLVPPSWQYIRRVYVASQISLIYPFITGGISPDPTQYTKSILSVSSHFPKSP